MSKTPSSFCGLSNIDRPAYFPIGWMNKLELPTEPTCLQSFVLEKYIAPLFALENPATGSPFHRFTPSRAYWLYRWFGSLVLCFNQPEYAASAEFGQFLDQVDFLNEVWANPQFRPFEDEASAGLLVKMNTMSFVIRLSASLAASVVVTHFAPSTKSPSHQRYLISNGRITLPTQNVSFGSVNELSEKISAQLSAAAVPLPATAYHPVHYLCEKSQQASQDLRTEKHTVHVYLF